MKSKNIALVLSTVLLTNTIGFSAYAQKSEGTKVDESLIEQSITAQSQEMKKNLDRVNALIKSIENYSAASQGKKQNEFVTTARFIISILGLGGTALHMKNVQAQSSIELTLAAVSGAVLVTLEKISANQKIDMTEIMNLLAKNQKELADSITGDVSKDEAALILGAVSQIRDINAELSNSMTEIKNTLDGGQTHVAIGAVITIALNYAAPFLPKNLKDIVSNKIPTLLGHAAKSKKIGMQALSGTNITLLLSTLASIAGKDAQAQLRSILSNLRVVQAKLNASLK